MERPPEGASAPATGPSRTHPEELEQRTEEMKLIVHAETGTQMIRDSLSEYCSIFSSCSSEQQDSYCNQEVWDFVPPQSSLSPAEPAAAQLPAFTVLLVNGTLWIPRSVEAPPQNRTLFSRDWFGSEPNRL